MGDRAAVIAVGGCYQRQLRVAAGRDQQIVEAQLGGGAEIPALGQLSAHRPGRTEDLERGQAQTVRLVLHHDPGHAERIRRGGRLAYRSRRETRQGSMEIAAGQDGALHRCPIGQRIVQQVVRGQRW